MRMLYGTFNPAKLAVMRRWLSPLGIEIVGLMEMHPVPEEADETGASPLDNARIKAHAYWKSTGLTTFAADSGLYLEGLPPEEQPGVHARRVDGRRLNDMEMIAHYSRIARTMGGKVVARYKNAMCMVFQDGQAYERFDDSLASKPFFLVDTPLEHFEEGFPLDALSVDIASGQYYRDLAQEEMDTDLVQGEGIRAFIQNALR